MQGVVVFLIIALLQIYQEIYQWKKNENWLRFDRIMAMRLWSRFFGPPSGLYCCWRCIQERRRSIVDSRYCGHCSTNINRFFRPTWLTQATFTPWPWPWPWTRLWSREETVVDYAETFARVCNISCSVSLLVLREINSVQGGPKNGATDSWP